MAASVILLGLAVVGWISHLTMALRVCDQQMCRPLGLLDMPVVTTALLALLLLAPDVSRVKFGPEGLEVETDTVGPDEDLADKDVQVDAMGTAFRAQIEQQKKEPK